MKQLFFLITSILVSCSPVALVLGWKVISAELSEEDKGRALCELLSGSY